MEIKFKPEPEKKIEGTENIPEKETEGTENKTEGMENKTEGAENKIQGTENIAENKTDGAENVSVTEGTNETQETEETGPENNREENAADVTAHETGGQKEHGNVPAGKDASDMETIGETSVEEPAHRRRRRARKGDVSSPEVDQEMIGEAVEKKPLRGWQKVMLALGAVVLAVILTFGFSIWREYSRTESVEGEPVEVTIAQGSGTKQVAEELKEAGVIRYETAFLLKIYFSDDRGKLRYGTFALNDGMCLADVIEALVTGGAQKEEESFTIPEGYSIPMIAEKLEQEGVMSQDEFLTAVKNAAADFVFKDQLPPAEQVFYQMEGYIFPDTYYLSEDMTGDELVAKILDEFQNKFDAKRQEEAAALGMSMEEVLIRASLVQKETDLPEEYSMVAGVINNRLAQNMRLQFDSTVVYALSQGMYGVERVLYDHLETDSPYNTYKNDGLPVGPICNPSQEAIDGVLHPAQHNYLYFQTDQVKNDGSNLYFETYEEHAAAAATTEVSTPSSGQAGETTAATETPAASSGQAGETEAVTEESSPSSGQSDASAADGAAQ